VKKKKPKKETKEKQTEQQFIDGYKAAHAMIYQHHDYTAGIDKLKSLGHDDNPDVANLIGYSSRKLGRYEDSKTWYERALAADPAHARTWSYYGMWHAEQGNLLKAREYLTKVETLCGTKCREYTELKGVIAGTAPTKRNDGNNHGARRFTAGRFRYGSARLPSLYYRAASGAAGSDT